MNIWASRSDIEKYVMAKIVELDKQASIEKLPSPIALDKIIPYEWLSSDFVVEVIPNGNHGIRHTTKRFSHAHSDLKGENKLHAYIYQLQKALLIVVTLLERLHNEKHIIFVRRTGGRISSTMVLGSSIDASPLSDNRFEITYIELIEKLTRIMEVDIVPMSSLIELVENDFKSESQIAFEEQERRHKETLVKQSYQHQQSLDFQQQLHLATIAESKRQNDELIKQQQKSFRVAVAGIIVAFLSSAIAIFYKNNDAILRLEDKTIKVQSISNPIDSLVILSLPKVSTDTLVVKTLTKKAAPTPTKNKQTK